MKKLLVLFLLCSSFVYGYAATISKEATCSNPVSATPSIVGTWSGDFRPYVEDDPTLSNLDKLKITLVFASSRTATIKLLMDGVIDVGEIAIELGMNISAKGTYSREGDVLNMRFSGAKPTFNIYKCKLLADEQIRAFLNAQGLSDQYIKDMMQKEMSKDVTDIVEGCGTLTIDELTDTQIVLTDEKGIAVRLYREKK